MRSNSARFSWRRHLPVLFLVSGLVFLLCWAGLKVYRLARLARSFQARMNEVAEINTLDNLGDLDPSWAREVVHGTRTDFVSLRQEVEPWLWLAPAFRWAPDLGSDLAIAEQLMELGDAATRMAVLLYDGLEPTLESLHEGNLSMQLLVMGLTDAQDELSAAESELARIEAARSAIPEDHYSSLTQSFLEKLDRNLPLARAGLGGARLLPEIMGINGPRSYLLVAQNEDEIRPTGGFFSSAGRITVEGGEIISLSFEDSYSVDDWKNHPYPELPLPFQQIMGAGIWLFRDANWSPDWPLSAQQAVELYQISRDVQIDGVFAIDQRAVQLLVEPLAPLIVRQDFEPVTAENVKTFMRDSWIDPAEGDSSEWIWYRKAFIGDLAAAMRAKLTTDLGAVDLPGLVQALRRSLDEKHILLYFQDQSLGDLVREAGWDGSLRTFPGDYLMVVDANMGFNKVAPVIQEGIEYRVLLVDPAAPKAELRLSYVHKGKPLDDRCVHQPDPGSSVSSYSDLVNQCFWNYVRVYPPAGTVPVAGSNHPVPGEFLTSRRDWPGLMVVAQEPGGFSSLANFFLLPWAESETVWFDYQLPPWVATELAPGFWRYQLLVQKQPGTIGNPLRVVVHLPAQAKLLTATPSFSRSGDEIVFELELRTDQEIVIDWSLAEITTGER